MSLAVCPRCSCRVPDDANFCRRCGSMLRVPPPLARPVSSETPRRRTSAAPAKKSGNGGGFWTLIVVAYVGARLFQTVNEHHPSPRPQRSLPAPVVTSPKFVPELEDSPRTPSQPPLGSWTTSGSSPTTRSAR